MACQHGSVTDVLSDHRFAQPVASDQDEIAGFGHKIQRQGTFNDVAFDPGRPRPFEIGHGLEALNTGEPKTALEAAARAFGDLLLHHVLENLMRRPAVLRGACEEVIEMRGGQKRRSERKFFPGYVLVQIETNQEGKAEFEGIPYGKLRIQAIAKGLQTYGEDLEISEPNHQITIKMNPPQEQYSIYK